MIDKFTHSPVFPIVPCYQNGLLCEFLTCDYMEYLYNNGAKIFMTTAGTTQFNLLTSEEIYGLNSRLSFTLPGKDCVMIAGIKPQSLFETLCDIEEYTKEQDELGTLFLLFKYPDRYYNDSTIISYFHAIAEASRFPCIIHCSPFMNGITGKPYDYTADLINKICEHDNIVGIKEETSDLMLAYDVVRELNTGIGIICAGGSQRRYRALRLPDYNKHEQKSTFLAGVGSMFPIIDDPGNLYLEDKVFKVFLKHGWHPALRHALQYLKLIPEYNRQPWPELRNVAQKEIENVVDEIKEMV